MEAVESTYPTFCVGQHERNRAMPITGEVVQRAHESNYDMLTVPITTSHFHSRVLSLLSSHLSSLPKPVYDVSGTMATTQNIKSLIIPPLSTLDTHLTPNEAISQLIGVTSSWIDLCSPDPLIADLSRQVLMLEVAYAAFCGIGYLLIPGPKLHHGSRTSEGLIYYARAILDALNAGPYIQFHLWFKMTDTPDLEVDEMGDLAPLTREEFTDVGSDDEPGPTVDPFGTWDAWDIIRRTCNYHSRLFVGLSLPKVLPSVFVQSRWYCEPVRLLTIDATTFIKNQKAYPVLSRAHQALIARHVRLRVPPWIILCDVGPIPGVESIETANGIRSKSSGAEYPSLAQAAVANKKHHDPTPHLSYIRNLQQRQPPRSAIERFGIGYQDYLQAPLQPLTVNLESITYEVFEKDPIKYEWYERAISKALSDWVAEKKPTSNPDGRVVVAVVGAGRGPLVTRALRASAQTGVEIDLWAVEKNPNAFVLLQRHNQTTWEGKVNLVQSDMRSWKGPRKGTTVQPLGPVGSSLGIADSLLYSGEGGDEKVTTPTAAAAASSSQTSLSTAAHMHIDILVSELLGSFGDNELSPECLDGVTHLLNPVHGISIPTSYTAHLTPISAPKLHADIMAQTVSNPAAPETPYVVMLHAIDFLSPSQPSPSSSSAPPPPPAAAAAVNNAGSNSLPNMRFPVSSPPLPLSASATASSTPSTSTTDLPTPYVQTAWSFSHPNRDITIPPQPGTAALSSTISNRHNVRQTRLTFPCPNRGVCHGLAGYFETVLYRDVELSTNPVTMDAKSKNMISWFPIYFPLKTPLNVPDNGEIVITMFRQTDDRKVWYEWMVEVFAVEEQQQHTTTTTKIISPTAGGGGGNIPLMSGGNSNSNSNSTSNGNGNAAVHPRNTRSRARGRRRRRVRVGMSDLHSSIKDGCLM